MERQIKERLKKFWTVAPVATATLVLSLTAAVIFGSRSVVFWIHRPSPTERELTIAAWMTPRYIARSWGVPLEIILEAIDAPRPPPDGPMSLTQLAIYRGVPTHQVIEEAQAAIAAFRDRPRK